MRIEPRATYRLQLHAGFTFRDAAAAVPYLADLGISHLYLSPILQAAHGSSHGYDVVDPERIDRERGGDEGFEALVTAARDAELGIILDIVPNHMSTAAGNAWWRDVLENGPASYYARYFDLDWNRDGRIVLPVLGQRYGRAIQSGAIRIVLAEHGFVVRAGDVELPLSPRALGTIVRHAADRIGHAELAFIGDALTALPAQADPLARRRRHGDKEVLLGRLTALREGLACAVALADEVAAVNADPAELDAILEAQAYRLAHWSVASDHLSYRRFFDVDSLIGMRTEDPEVFAALHARVLQLVESGAIDGLRVDHVDGLRDPAAYLARLRERAPDAWIVVEKITTADEALPANWPVEGTTGYDAVEKIGGLFVDPSGERAMTRTFEQFTGETWQPREASRRARLEVMSDALHSEVARLVELAVATCAASPLCRDFTRTEIERALTAILANLSTYRTYFTAENHADIDRARLSAAAAAAADQRLDLDPDVLRFLESALAFELAGDAARELAELAQQITGAITAKGDEDTLLYRQVRLLSRCEVGAELAIFAHTPSAVHHALAGLRPRTLIATSTHDTKRGEDVRARISVLSEIPAAWARAVNAWRRRADHYWTIEPDRVIEYALWQTIVGAWPISRERAGQFATKATREARLRTSWRAQDATYEAGLAAWLDGVFGDRELLAEVARFSDELARHGDRNSLAQLLVKLTAPGVPDIYQGCELTDLHLVDPDNRTPVDLGVRRDLLRVLKDAAPAALSDLDARKLWTIRRVLGLRRKHPARFLGAYRALDAAGPHAHRVFAFSRGTELIAAVPRLGVAADGWRGTTLELPPGTWLDVLSDQTISGGVRPVAELWRVLPAALYTRAG